MKTNANSIKIGNILIYNKKFYTVLKREHTMPGKGGAFVQVEMKGVEDNTKMNVRFRSSETVEVAFVEEIKYQYQYDDGDRLVCMNMETFDTDSFDKALLGDMVDFLESGMDIYAQSCESKIVALSIPEHINVKIAEADSVVKGQTATSSYKPAITENGTRVMVPQFIEREDEIVVNTKTREYVEKAKK